MNDQETSRILSCITAVYPSFLKGRDPKQLNCIWQRIFANVPYEEVERAVTAFIATDTKGFPPAPGAINAYITKRYQLSEPTAEEAWALVARAASRGLYNSGEEFAKLPAEVQKIVVRPAQLYEWANMSSELFNTTVAAWFKRAWRERQELKRELCPILPAPGQGLFLEE